MKKEYISSKLSNFEKVNNEFLKTKISVCSYDQIANSTKFTKESIERAVPTLNYAPVIGYFSEENGENGEADFGGHGQELVLTDNGIEMKVKTVPFGVMIKDSARWEKLQKPNGEYEEYLCADAYLWSRYEKAINKVKENKCNQSMEVTINNGEYKDNYFEIQDFSFGACCILGESTRPAFEISKIRTADSQFAKDEFHNEYTEMLDKLNTFLYEEENKTGGEEIVEENKEKEFEEVQDSTVEEPVVEESTESSNEDFTETNENEGESEEDFAKCGGGSKKDDEDKKKKMSETEESQTEENFEEKYNALNEEFNALQEKYNALESEIIELRAYKADNEKAIRKAEEEKIYSNFEEIKENEEFKALKEDSTKYSLEELEMRCYAILGKAKKAKSLVEEPQQNKSTQIFSSVDVNYEDNKPHGKYDHLIEKYGKR